MVNVGGRSKACSTCRRRRVKCDENRPACSRCQRCGLACEGPKDTTFIEGTIVNSRRSQNRAIGWKRHDIEEQDFAVRPIFQSTILLKHNEREVYICYARKHLRPDGPVDLGLQNLQLADIVTAPRANGPIFSEAILSFATIIFGTQHQRPSIINQGYAMHGATLKQLNHALSDRTHCTRDEVILSVVTLAMLECLVPTGPKVYLKHMLGLDKILELCDPASVIDCTPNTRELYKGVRQMIIFASLRTRTRSILARPDWKAVWKKNCSDMELQEQDLYDALADCTVLIAERDEVMNTLDSDNENLTRQREQLEHKALALLSGLHAWRRRWVADTQPARSKVVSTFQEGIHEINNFPASIPTAVFEFSNESQMLTLMLYSTTLTHVLQLLVSLPLEQHSKDDFVAAERLAALEIAECIPYYLALKISSPRFCSPVFQWAVTTAWTALGRNESAEGRWIVALLNAKMTDEEVVAKGVWEV